MSVTHSSVSPSSPKGRNHVISICKGIAIILMVLGHTDAPFGILGFVYPFHMPLFFIAAGYFFSLKYLDDPWSFIRKRIKGLYFPFLKWSILFLLLHNLWFDLGLLNESYGNWSGGVTHPYSFSVAMQRLVMMVTGMAGYDEFMAGAFWFFRGLFVASIVFLLLYKLIMSHTRAGANWSVVLICVLMILFTALHIEYGFKVTTIPNGAWRETWGVFFFGLGVLYRTYEKKIVEHWGITLFYIIILCISATLHFSGMNNSGRWRDLWSLPLTGSIGFLMIHYFAVHIERRKTKLRSLLIFIGDNTLYIFVFHIISFKVVSWLKILYYDMDPLQIGCHMVIHDHHDDYFFILYTFAGVGLPLIWLMGYNWFKRNYIKLITNNKSKAPTPKNC